MQPDRRAYAALPLGWAALLLYLTLAPAERLPPQPHWQLLSFDTFCHAAFFAVQAGLSWFSLRRQLRWPTLARRAGLVVLLGCTLFGAIIEVLQMLLPFNRHGEWSDLLSDTLGTALALGWLTMLARRRPPGWALGLLVLLTAAQAHGQDLPRARRTIERLASPRLHGRGYVQQGEHKAAAYLRGRLRQLGLQPLAPNYTQPFTLDVNTFPGRLKLALDFGFLRFPVLGDSRTLRAGRDFIAAPESGGGRLGDAFSAYPLARVDSLILTDPAVQTAWQQRRLYGLLLDKRTESRLGKLPLTLRQHLDSAAFALTIVPKLTASLAAAPVRQMKFEVSQEAWDRANRGNSKLPFFAARCEARLRRDYPTQNLAAFIPGRVHPDSFLVVSAHYDHLGTMGRKAYFPGANDNASGVALLLELAAHYARPENQPACSIAFLLFGAEEAGLVGSSYFVAHPLIPLRKIKFLVNLDLLGTGEEGATVVNGRAHANEFADLTRLNAAGHYLPSLGARGKAANSDHYPFSEAGVPAFFIYTRGGSKAYHDVNDRPAALSLAGFAGAFQLVRDFLNEQAP